MTTDITELALITKIKKQLENFDTVVLLASIGTASVAWEGTICALRPQSYPVSNRHTGKAAERRNAKRRRRAKK